MKKRNQIYILAIVIIVFLTSILAFTFAYIGRANVASGNTNVNTTINGVLLTYTGSNKIGLDIDYDDLLISNSTNDYSEYISSTINGTVTLNVPSSYANGATCQYRIVYIPIDSYIASSAATNANLRELELIIGDGTNTLNTVSLAGLTNKATIYTTSISTNTGNTTASQTWVMTLKFYNLNVDQGDALGQRPTGSIEIEPIICGGR